jgi:DNA-binding transcriptional ArsR family regulator
MKSAARRRGRRPSRKASPVWRALADPTRRTILDLLRDSPRTSGQLAGHFATTRFAVRKHLNLLEAAGLVVVRPKGRERWHYLNAMPIHTVYERWVTPYQAHWAGKLSRLKHTLEKGEPMPAPATSNVQRVELELAIAAPPGDVWRALLHDTTFWWPRDFYTGPAKGFHIEPRLGGNMFEDWGDGNGVVWYQIFAINPGVSLDLHGCLAVPYGPAISLLHIELAQTVSGTMLKVSDSTIGDAHDSASKTEGWQQIFGSGLKAYVEARR